jgi:hypothetical protein
MIYKLFSFGLAVLAVVLCTVLTGCPPVKEEVTDIPVNAVYYGDLTDDVIYYGESISNTKKVYLLGVVLEDSSKGSFDSKTDWKSLCRIDNNVILWAGIRESGLIPIGNFDDKYFKYVNLLLRLQTPLDPINDLGKKIYFDTDKTINSQVDAIIYKNKISTPEKIIDFSLYNQYK